MNKEKLPMNTINEPWIHEINKYKVIEILPDICHQIMSRGPAL